MNRFSELLYNRPTFLSGMARCLDFGGTMRGFNTSDSGEEADRVALASDWFAIGEDIREVALQHVLGLGLDAGEKNVERR